MTPHQLAARLKKLEARAIETPGAEGGCDLLRYLTARELDFLVDVEEAMRNGSQVDVWMPHLEELEHRAQGRSESPLAEDILTLLNQESMIGPVEDLPARYPGFEVPTHPLVEALFRGPAERLSAFAPWADLFPQAI